MSVSRGGGGVTSTDGLNWETVGDTTADTTGVGIEYNLDVDLPDKHVMAVHAISFSISDVYDATEGQAELWVYADEDAPNQNSWDTRALNDDLIFHANLGYAAESGNTILNLTQTYQEEHFPLPVLRGDGELALVQSGTSDSGSDLEWRATVYYDIVPAQDTDAYLELLLKN